MWPALRTMKSTVSVWAKRRLGVADSAKITAAQAINRCPGQQPAGVADRRRVTRSRAGATRRPVNRAARQFESAFQLHVATTRSHDGRERPQMKTFLPRA